MKHLSWSSYNLFKKSKIQFVKKYILGEEIYETEEMIFGKDIAKTIEDRNINVPYLDNMEYRIYADVAGAPCLSYIDSCSSDLSLFYEYKTGKNEWDQERVNNHGQLLFYASVIHSITGNIPSCSLFWLPTKDSDEGIELTGDIYEFQRKFTLNEILEYKQEIAHAWQDIQEFIEQYKNQNVNVGLLYEYSYIIQQIKELESKAEELKPLIDAELKGIPMSIEGVGTFYYSERKKYTLPEEFIKKEEMLKKERKELEKTLTPEITKTLSFKL